MLAPPHCYSVIFWFYFHLSSLSSISFWLLFRCPVVSDYLWPHGLQDARPPRPSPSSGVCASSCPLHCWCRPASYPLSPSSPALSLSQHQGLFQWVGWWPKYWRFSFSINPSSEYSGLTSFRIDCIDFLAVQRTLRSLLQQHSINYFLSSISLFITFIIFIYLSNYHLLPVFYKKCELLWG